MRVSVIIPVRNEEATIKDLLDSLLAQTRKPDEIIITDGGSTDRTKLIINQYIKKDFPIRLICLPEAFPGKGRNTSINHSKNELIASIDAGCIPNERWLEELIKPLEKDFAIDVVFGVYKPAPRTLFEKCFVLTTESVEFKPTAASMAFKKTIWHKVHGFPELLKTGEDRCFISKLQNCGCKIRCNNKAEVFWRPRSTLFAFYQQCYEYAKGKVMINVYFKFHLRKLLFYIFLFCMLIMSFLKSHVSLITLICAYLGWIYMSVIRHYEWFEEIKNQLQTYIILPLVIFVRDVATIFGFIYGIFQKVKND